MLSLSSLFTTSEPTLSEARSADAAAMAALHASAFRRGWSEGEFIGLLDDGAVLAHRAVAGRHLVGFIMSRQGADEAEILSIAVSARMRGKGLGGKLLNLHLRRLAGIGVRAVFLEVDEDNVAARRLYERAGFAEVGRREAYYRDAQGRPTTALVLKRDLA